MSQMTLDNKFTYIPKMDKIPYPNTADLVARVGAIPWRQDDLGSSFNCFEAKVG